MSLRAQVKSVLSPVVRAAWPVVESIGEIEGRAAQRGMVVQWSNDWTPELDRALDALPPMQGWPRDLYRELVKPTDAHKRHALVLENGAPSVLFSLRRCARHWEPVAYQCLPFTIAPALDNAAIARAIGVLGMEVRVPAGIREEVHELRPSDSWAYDFFVIDLEGDYEAYWRERKRQKRLRRARRDTAHLTPRIDGAGDLDWVVEQWRDQWKNDPGQEGVAAADRLNVWRALQHRDDAPMKLNTLMLMDGARRVAGLVLLSRGDTISTQCSFRDPAYADSGTATTLLAVEWAKQRGFRTLDLGGGTYKRDWGPVGGQRYGVVFRPALMNALSWACTY